MYRESNNNDFFVCSRYQSAQHKDFVEQIFIIIILKYYNCCYFKFHAIIRRLFAWYLMIACLHET